MTEIPVLACRLDALDSAEQARRAALAERTMARFVAVHETVDGYVAWLASDAAGAREALDWMLLERRCCPFLCLELGFQPESETMWLRFGGGLGVKEFLTSAGLRATGPSSDCFC